MFGATRPSGIEDVQTIESIRIHSISDAHPEVLAGGWYIRKQIKSKQNPSC